VPGDEIIGYITMGSGIAVHKAKCPSLLTAEPERLLEVQWSGSAAGPHRAELLLKAHDRKNLLADISSAISSDDANIIEMNSRTRADNIAEFRVLVEVSGLDQLHRLQIHLSQLPSVTEVRRAGRA
jgi:GTP pyrophosphokinase